MHLTEPQAYRLACTTCNALPFEYCTRRRHWPTRDLIILRRPHPARILAAIEVGLIAAIDGRDLE